MMLTRFYLNYFFFRYVLDLLRISQPPAFIILLIKLQEKNKRKKQKYEHSKGKKY